MSDLAAAWKELGKEEKDVQEEGSKRGSDCVSLYDEFSVVFLIEYNWLYLCFSEIVLVHVWVGEKRRCSVEFQLVERIRRGCNGRVRL